MAQELVRYSKILSIVGDILQVQVPEPDAGEEAVDAAFLEYLGEWEEVDADWLLFEEVELTAASEHDEPVEEEAASPESEDES